MSAEQLVRACAESHDSAAWDEFVSRFQRAISLSIIRAAYQWGYAPRQVVDDLVQETYLKLCADKCRLLHEFVVRHPEAIVGYVKVVAVNVAHDCFKALHSQKRGAGDSTQSLEDVEPKALGGSLGGHDAIEREVLLKEINQCLESHSEGPDKERDRMIFWLYYQQGMSARSIAALTTVGLSPKGVESAISRLTRVVREHILDVRPESTAKPADGEKGYRPAESY
jgi:RNA polymerase sigma-70 factor (ECF subfamily)